MGIGIADRSCAPRTERSDFATVELARNVVGANSVRPLLRICCDFRIVGDATQFLFHRNGRPIRRGNAVVVVSLMLGFFRLPNKVYI